jgi:hypothetical protein
MQEFRFPLGAAPPTQAGAAEHPKTERIQGKLVRNDYRARPCTATLHLYPCWSLDVRNAKHGSRITFQGSTAWANDLSREP